VVFVPFSGGKPTDPAKFETFADGFVGGPVGVDATDKAKHRPVSMAVAPDGSLFITDDPTAGASADQEVVGILPRNGLGLLMNDPCGTSDSSKMASCPGPTI